MLTLLIAEVGQAGGSVPETTLPALLILPALVAAVFFGLQRRSGRRRQREDPPGPLV